MGMGKKKIRILLREGIMQLRKRAPKTHSERMIGSRVGLRDAESAPAEHLPVFFFFSACLLLRDNGGGGEIQ